jgi:hypothetical protein
MNAIMIWRVLAVELKRDQKKPIDVAESFGRIPNGNVKN